MLSAMSGRRGILVLHGITMSGAAVLRTLGPLRLRLEALGFELVAPNAGHRLSGDELTALSNWMAGRYRELGQSYADDFSDGRFWDAGEHYDWFQANTDAQTGKKTYHALERSLDLVAASIRDRDVVGVLGFSQGAAMATVVAARAVQGDARFASIRWGMFLSGFKPVFDEPALISYPAGKLPRLLAIGERDPIFPGNAAYLAAVSRAFEGGEQELVVVPGLGHEVSQDPEIVERLASFAVRWSTDA
jgi:predicted esterase